MKVIVSKVRDIPLVFRQSVAFVASATCVKDIPPALGGGIDGVFVAGNEVVEGRIKRQLCSLVGRDGAQQGRAVGRGAEDAAQSVLPFPDGCDPVGGSLQAGLAHLN